MNQTRRQPAATFALIILGTVVGIAGIDLVLPAIPNLPNTIPGTLTQAQFVLASFTTGVAIGLLIFGELGARFQQRWLLIGSLASYALLSLLATFSTNITELVQVRFFQGLTSAAPAVFAPGMIRVLFDEPRALRALGFMGSIESIVPALAPLLGVWLLVYFDWRGSFIVTAAIASTLAIIWIAWGSALPRIEQPRVLAGYLSLLRNRRFMRFALSQAFTLGGLFIFVFGAPTVITIALRGTLTDFVTMQVIGISFFIVATNLADRIVQKFGNEVTIMFGSSMSAFGAVTIFLYASFGGASVEPLWILFIFVNLGLGIRGPPGFYQAIEATDGNDARGSALVILLVLTTAAAGTAIVAPFISIGLLPLSFTAALVSLSSVGALRLMR